MFPKLYVWLKAGKGKVLRMKIMSINWWTSALMSAFMTMVMFYIIKKLSAKVNVPIVSDIIAQS